MASFENARMQGASFAEGPGRDKARMQGAILRGAELRGTELYVIDLQVADLGEAQLEDADLQDVMMHGASLGRTRMQNTKLGWVEMLGVSFGQARLQGIEFGHNELSLSELERAFGDASVRFEYQQLQHPNYQRPNHWPTRVLRCTPDKSGQTDYDRHYAAWLADPDAYDPDADY